MTGGGYRLLASANFGELVLLCINSRFLQTNITCNFSAFVEIYTTCNSLPRAREHQKVSSTFWAIFVKFGGSSVSGAYAYERIRVRVNLKVHFRHVTKIKAYVSRLSLLEHKSVNLKVHFRHVAKMNLHVDRLVGVQKWRSRARAGAGARARRSVSSFIF